MASPSNLSTAKTQGYREGRKAFLGVLCAILCVFAVKNTAYSQTTPLQIQVSVLPPYSAYLQDYPGTGQRVRVFIINTSRQTYQVRLTGQLTGDNGIEIRTSPNYRPPRPLTVPPGQTLLSRADLEGLFDLNQIDVTGIDKNVLARGLPLPDGTYQLCVRAYNESATNTSGTPFGQPLSPEFPLGCSAPILVRSVEPPMLIAPLCDGEVTATQPQAVVFTWTPPAGVSPAQVDYTLRIVELPQGVVDPNVFIDAVALPRSGVEVTNLRTSTFLYGPTQPPLVVGKRYAWRVQAIDRSRKLNFLNDGKAPVCAFTYGTGLPTLAQTPGLELTQTPTLAIPALNVIPGVSIPDSKTGLASGAPVQKVMKSKLFCKAVELPDSTNPQTDPLKLKDKTIKLGEFDLTVATATVKNGSFTGEGRVTWNGAPIKVKFSNLRINGQNQVFDGDVTSDSKGPQLPNVSLGQLESYANLPNDYFDKIPTKLADAAGQAVALPLPLKYDGKLGTVGINQMSFSPVGARMDMVLGIALPEASLNLFLAATDVCARPQQKVPTTGNLHLVKDFPLPIPGSIGQKFVFKKSNLSSTTPEGTYASIVNSDFDKVHAVLDLNLGGSILKLDDGKGGTKGGDVIATLKADFEQWSDWIGSASLPAFQVPGTAGVTFTGVALYYDHSDKANPAGFNPPNEYPGDKGPTFRGAYFKKLTVELPTALKNDPRISVAVEGGIIDELGFTGLITQANKPILDYTKGTLGGFGFSLEEMDVLLVASKYIHGGFSGKIQVPISSDPLAYSCTMQGVFDQLQFTTVPPAGGLHVPLFVANMTLAQNTAITINYKAGKKTTVLVNLCGQIEINTAFAGSAQSYVDAVLPKVDFQDFSVANDAQFGGKEVGGSGVFLNAGKWGLTGGLFPDSGSDNKGGTGKGGPADSDDDLAFTEPMDDKPSNGKAAGFPIYFDTPKFVTTPDGTGLQFGIGIKLGGDDKSLLDGHGKFDVLGTITKDGSSRLSPSFNGVYIREIALKGDLGPVNVDGKLNFFRKDQKFGNGFKGKAIVNIPAVGAGIDMVMLFGKTNDYHYFYLDANAHFSPGVPMVGPLLLTGFGGGVLYNLAVDKLPGQAPAEGDKTGEADMINIGATPSGVVYTPQKGAWGIKARVFAGLVDTHVFNASAELAANFENGGMTYLGLIGQGVVISQTGIPANKDGVVNADVTMAWSKGLAPAGDAFDVAINVNGNFLGSSVNVPVDMHFSSSAWHVKLGDPYGAYNGADGKRVTANLLNINTDLLTVKLGLTGYAAVGNDMHTLPALPKDVIDFFNSHPDKGVPANGNQKTVAAMEQKNKAYDTGGKTVPSGGDFALMLGGALDGTLKVQCMPFRLRAHSIVGFDAALFKNQTCQDGSPPAGMMGWYGTGQVYAYFTGAVDLYVDVWFYEGSLELMSLQAGAQLKGGFPSPSWAEGAVAVQGSVLDGLISVSTDAHFSFGEKCQPVFAGDPLKDIKIISDVQPGDKDKAIDCRPTIAVAFNMPMNKPFTVNIPNGDDSPGGNPRIYLFQPQPPTLTYSTAQKKNQPVTDLDAPVWSPDKQSYSVQLKSYLPSYAVCRFSQRVVVKEQVSSGNKYHTTLLDPYIDKLKTRTPRSQDSTVTFTLGPQPNEIPLKDLAMSWPVHKQVYFLKDQQKTGFVSGNFDGLDILKDVNNPAYQYEMVFQAFDFVNGLGNVLTKPVSYNGNGLIAFDLPGGLKNSQAYFMTLRKRTKAPGSGKSGSLTQFAYADLAKNGQIRYQRASINTSTYQAMGAVSANDGQKLLELAFMTSQYNTFAEKMKGLQLRASDYNAAYQLQIGSTADKGYEGFDAFELVGGAVYPNATVEPFLSEQAPVGKTPFEQQMQTNLYNVMNELSINDSEETTTNYNSSYQEMDEEGYSGQTYSGNPVTTDHYYPPTISQTDVQFPFFRNTTVTNAGAPIYLGPNEGAILHSGAGTRFSMTYYRDQIMQNDLGAMVGFFRQMRLAHAEGFASYYQYKTGKAPQGAAYEAYRKANYANPTLVPYVDQGLFWQTVYAKTTLLSLKGTYDVSFTGSKTQQYANRAFFNSTNYDYGDVPQRQTSDPFTVVVKYGINGAGLFAPVTYTQTFHRADINNTPPVLGSLPMRPVSLPFSVGTALKNF